MFVFSKSRRLLTANDLAEFIRDGVYFEQVSFLPPPGSVESLESAWGSLQATCEAGAITFTQWLDADLNRCVSEILESILELREPGSLEDQIAGHLQQSQQAIQIEVDPTETSDNSAMQWMLAGLQRYLVSEHEGLIYRPADGFYGANLEPILRIA